MKQYDAYLFDWDGTLGQTFVVWMKIVQETLAKYNLEADEKTIVRKVFGNSSAGLIELGVPEKDLPDIYKVWDRDAGEHMKTMFLYPGAREILEKLHTKDKKLALITATVRPTVEVALVAHKLQDYFAVTVTGDEVSAHKPDPEGLLLALKKLNVSKDRAVMLGDSEKDVLAAHNAGIDSVLFYPPEHDTFHVLTELQSHKPTYTIHSWQELIDQLQ